GHESVHHHRHQQAHPGRVVDAARIADPKLELARAHRPSQPHGEPQGDEEAVAPHPLQEIGAHQVIEGAGLAHAALRMRLPSRTARYASSRLGATGLASATGGRSETTRAWTPSPRRMALLIFHFSRATGSSALGITHSHTFPSTRRNNSSGAA